MSIASGVTLDPIERERSGNSSPSSSSATGTSLESSSSSDDDSTSSSSESEASTLGTQSMTKERLVRRIMKQLSISSSSLGTDYESESSIDNNNSRAGGSKTSKTSSRKNGKMIDSILKNISGESEVESKKSRKETEETGSRTEMEDTEMEETEMEQTEAEETEMEETEMEQTEVEETEVEETSEETTEEEEENTDEDDAEQKEAADAVADLAENADISPVIRGVLSDDTDPRVIRPPPIPRRTKVIDEELATTRLKRETPTPQPNASTYSYFPTFEHLFGCNANKQLEAAADVPDTKVPGESSGPALLDISSKESEVIAKTSSRGKSTDGSEKDHHAPIVVQSFSETHALDPDEEDHLSTSGSASQPLVDPATLVNGRDSALLDMALNPVLPAELPAASSGASSTKSKTTGRKLVMTHSMPLDMKMSTDSGYAGRDMLRTIRSDDAAGTTRSAAKRRDYKKGRSLASSMKKRVDDPSKVQATTRLSPNDEPTGTKDKDANESVSVVDNDTPYLNMENDSDHHYSPKNDDGVLHSVYDTTEEEKMDKMIMESTPEQLMSGALDDTAGDTHINGQKQAETQPVVRLSKKLKHWAVKKRGKQDNANDKNTEAASLDSASLSSMSDNRPSAARKQLRKPKKRGRRRKTNLFRSIANYVRNQAPTLPVISEDPDHPDHNDHDDEDSDYLIAAPSAEGKVQDSMPHTREQVVDRRSSHDDEEVIDDNPVKYEQDNETGENIKSISRDPITTDDSKEGGRSKIVSPRSSFEPKEGMIVTKRDSNSQEPDDKIRGCSSDRSFRRQEVSKSRSTATAEDANASAEDTQTPEGSKTFDSDQRSSIAATVSSEVLNAKSSETAKGATSVSGMVGSNDDDDVASEMGMELALAMPDGNVEKTKYGSHVLSVDIAALNNDASSSFDSSSNEEEEEEDQDEDLSYYREEKVNQAFKNFFRLSITKPRGKKHADKLEATCFSADIGEVEDGFQASLKTKSKEYNQPAVLSQKPSRFMSRKNGKQGSSKSPEKVGDSLDRKPTWTELKSMSSVSASTPVEMRSLSSEDGDEDQKKNNPIKIKNPAKRTTKAANKTMRKVLNFRKSRKNVDERSPGYEESRESTTSGRDTVEENTEERSSRLENEDENIRMPPPMAEDMVEADLSGPIPLRRWDSVEQKIDESLKKVEALAANYGEDFNAMLLNSTSYGGNSSIGEDGFLVESESSEWREVEKKIDDSLSVAQKLARRLGMDASE